MTESSQCSLAVVGDGSTGKSSIINAFRTEGFLPIYKQTIGCDFYEKSIILRGKNISLKVWDIGGQSIHSKIIGRYVESATVIFLVYDVTNMESFSNLNDWLSITRQYSKANYLYLVGNKIDLVNLRQVTESQHEQFILINNLFGGLFMSAKSGMIKIIVHRNLIYILIYQPDYIVSNYR